MKMDKNNIDDIVKIRPHGTIIIENSILCDGGNYYGMDDGKNITCYTHIHSDHICGLEDALGRNNSRVYSTKLTKELSSALLMHDAEWIKDRTNYFGLENDELIRDGDFEISFKKAHHILGSAQLLVRSGRNSILYSSDFILHGTDIVKDVDYLILDTTHGRHSKSQIFDDMPSAKSKIIKRARKILKDSNQLVIYANRGTIQSIMSWLRSELDEDVLFIAGKNDVNVARIYSMNGFPCGDIEDDEKFEYSKNKKRFIMFRTLGSKPIESIPSIRIGASSSTSIDDTMHSTINLQEHATVSDICDYVKNINPGHIVLDNSKRTGNFDNALYLGALLKKMGFSTSLSPETHPLL